MKYVPLSKSGVSTVDKCPEKAHLHKNCGIESIGNIYANKGKAVHKLKEMIDTGQIKTSEIHLHSADPDVIAWTELAIQNDPFHGYQNRVCETHVCIDAEGNWVDDEDLAAAHGYLDDVVFPADEQILEVIDLKTGLGVYDDIVERHFYAGLFAKAAQPEYDKIRFTRYYCRTGKRPSWLYEWEKRKDGTTSLHITDHKGGRKQVRGPHVTNPLVPWLQKLIKKIEMTPVKPNPGSHCRNWYGTPCQFLGNMCSLSDQVPDLVPIKIVENAQKEALLRFFKAKDKEYLSLDANSASLALEAVNQLDSGIKDVEKKLKEWSSVNGHIKLHDELYGWEDKIEPVINKAVVLEYLYNQGLLWDEMAKAVNISKSSIEKLPKTMDKVKACLINLFGSQARRKFGLISKD